MFSSRRKVKLFICKLFKCIGYINVKMYDLKNKIYIYFLVCFFSKVFVYLKYIPVLPVMFVHSHLMVQMLCFDSYAVCSD